MQKLFPDLEFKEVTVNPNTGPQLLLTAAAPIGDYRIWNEGDKLICRYQKPDGYCTYLGSFPASAIWDRLPARELCFEKFNQFFRDEVHFEDGKDMDCWLVCRKFHETYRLVLGYLSLRVFYGTKNGSGECLGEFQPVTPLDNNATLRERARAVIAKHHEKMVAEWKVACDDNRANPRPKCDFTNITEAEFREVLDLGDVTQLYFGDCGDLYAMNADDEEAVLPYGWRSAWSICAQDQQEDGVLLRLSWLGGKYKERIDEIDAWDEKHKADFAEYQRLKEKFEGGAQ